PRLTQDDELCVGLVVPLEVLGRDHGAVVHAAVPPGCLVKGQLLVTCAYKSLCQQALLSGNDVVLQCDHLKASWYFSSFQGEDPFLVSSLPNIKKLPGGSLQLNKPQPSQTGLYRCEDSNTALVVEYEIDFQDVTTLHITHKGLGQNHLQNQSLSLGRQEIIFTHWEPWQDCNRCGVPGERKRLGYCYIQEPVFWEANNLSLTWKDQLSGKSVSTIMDTSNGGSWLRVFQPATYRCFVQQELTAQFNSQSNVDPLKFLSPGKSEQQPEAKETQKEKANSVLKGLSVMMLVGTVLTLLGCLRKQFRFSRSQKRNKMLLNVETIVNTMIPAGPGTGDAVLTARTILPPPLFHAPVKND
ncbi:hypothetical protein Celaphus_00004523, partial [Cervus elaphus hippelaphus]